MKGVTKGVAVEALLAAMARLVEAADLARAAAYLRPARRLSLRR